jgi:ABC-type glycerol-3-phosphate transport system substrate-binding protein
MSIRIKRFTLGAIAVTALAAGGAALGNAATSQSTATTTTSSASIPAPGSAAHEGSATRFVPENKDVGRMAA